MTKFFSEETRKRMSEAKLGRRLSSEHRIKIAKSLIGNRNTFGHVLSEEHKRKISDGNKGRVFSVSHRENISQLRRGTKSLWWKGGITEINKMLRKSFEYKEWRRKVFERDDYLCVIGGKRHSNRLNADHIKSFSEYPELRFVVSNGRTLCVACHRKTPTFGGGSKSKK